MALNDRVLARFTMAVPDAGTRAIGRLQARLYRLSGGRIGGQFGRSPVLALTTTGRRSGEPRCTSVLYRRDGERFVVVGSNTGSERTPAWALNLVANPEAEVLVGRERKRVQARQAEGDELAQLWDLMSDQYHGFDMYRSRTARQIKLFVLDPV